MIKIDGHKIKSLREQQGLTQLYLATAVDVTTDTISRWENKRYPSIKKENGIRLAEALEVDLNEILDTQNETVPPQPRNSAEASTPSTFEATQQKSLVHKNWPILLLAGTLFGVIIAFIYFYFQMASPPTVTATRISPSHCIAGQLFPVTIELSAESDTEIAFILKESIPSDAHIIQTQPEHNGKSSQTPFLKWITKSRVPTAFSYLTKMRGEEDSSITLDGSIATAGGDAMPTGGNSTITIGHHHWADSDKNNVISDEEILTVYDKYAEILGLAEEVDLIEEIWLGEGYSWNSDTQEYDIKE